MLRRAGGKAMWLGGKVSAVFGLALAVALVLGAATVALAAVPGDPFKLGKVNAINNALTALTGSRAGGAMMLIDNNSNAANSRAVDLRVQPGRAPLTVNADAGKAGGLNADKVDGADAPLWAMVVDNGSLVRSRGATAAARDSEGVYRIDFSRDVSGCALSATSEDDLISIGAGMPSGAPNRVFVRSRDIGNGNLPSDSAFYLVVFC